MNITVEKLPKSEIKMTVELSELTMQKYHQQAVAALSKQVNVPGFRPGKVPAEVVEQKLNPQMVLAQAVDLALPPTYTEAVKKENIVPIARPRISILQENPLKYEAVIATYPEVKVDGYDKIKVEKKDGKVTPEDIEGLITSLQKQNAVAKDVDRAAQMGDRVEIDFEGFDEGGAPLDGTISKNHPLVIGDKSLIPGFEEELVGMTKDQEKEFMITFPADYHHTPFQSKKVKFKVAMRRIEEMTLPTVNEEFVKTVMGEAKSVEDFRKDVEKEMAENKKFEAKNATEGEILQKVLEITKVELPPTVVDQEMEYMIEEMAMDMESKGFTLDKYLEATKKTIDELKETKRKEAESRLTLRFGLQEIFKQAKIEVSEEELNNELAKEMMNHAHHPGHEDHGTDKEFLARLENRIKMDKLFDRLLQ